ncbi:MAG: hypothetical protein KC619_26385, partial [Myxococcales bacterium]|nr:hypothetical protein [Myxococcales bacterium]
MSVPFEKSFRRQGATVLGFMRHSGDAALLAWRATVSLFTTRFEARQFIYQLDQLGVRSFGIAAATAIFVG